MTVDEAIAELANAKGNFKCNQMVRLLESLGFKVEDAKTKHHKKVKHPGLPNFYGADFACPPLYGIGSQSDRGMVWCVGWNGRALQSGST